MRARTEASPRAQRPELAPRPPKAKGEVLKIPKPDPINEQVVIAACIVAPDWRKKLCPIIPPDSFFGAGHAEIWEVLRELEAKGLSYDPATVKQLSGGKVDTDYLDTLIQQRPAAPPNLMHHVEMLRWDRTRIEVIRGPVASFLEAVRDPLTEPGKLQTLARNIGGALSGFGSQRYLRDPEHLKASVMAGIRERRAGKAIFPFGLPGFDIYGAGEEKEGQYRMIPGLAPKKMTVITGVPGCLAGETEIELNRAGKSFKLRLSEVVRRFNGGVASGKIWAPEIPTTIRVRTADGYIRLGRLADAFESGEKQTFALVTDSGRMIRATEDHRFLSSEGWKPLRDLRPGDFVHVDGGVQAAPHKPKPYYSYSNAPGHPYAIRKRRRPTLRPVATHRLVMEAALSGLELPAFLARLRAGRTEGLVLLDPELVAVHHRDENPRNNAIENLEVLTHDEHRKRHADGRHGLAQSVLERVAAVTKTGIEPTYDLTIDGEPHNFLANGFVTHNSAKTTVTAQIALSQIELGRKILYGAWEQGSELTFELMASQSLRLSRSQLSTGEITDEEEQAIADEIDRLSPCVRFFELPFGRDKGEKILNDRSLDLLHEMIVTSGCEIAIFDLWRRSLRQLDPDEEEIALYRQQAILQETGAHGILIHQLRAKDVEQRQDKRPTREALKGSGAWIEVPDTILGVHREFLFKDVPDNVLQLVIMKQRHGTAPLAVDFDWDADLGLLTNGRGVLYERAGMQTTGGGDGSMDAFLAGGAGAPGHGGGGGGFNGRKKRK